MPPKKSTAKPKSTVAPRGRGRPPTRSKVVKSNEFVDDEAGEVLVLEFPCNVFVVNFCTYRVEISSSEDDDKSVKSVKMSVFLFSSGSVSAYISQ
jgi:hypothetical protein